MARSTGDGGTAALKLVDLAPVVDKWYLKSLASVVGWALEEALCLAPINRAYASVAHRLTPDNFFRVALETLRVRTDVSETDVARIPAEGPVVVVANHPFGGIEGLVLGELVMRRRTDVRILGNQHLMRIPQMRPWTLPVDVINPKRSLPANARAMARALKWVKKGGVLVTFPAGEVSHLKLSERRVVDSEWKAHIAAIVRRGGATVVPVYFPGRNGALFQAAGLLHPALRTALLPRELMNKTSSSIAALVGRPRTWDSLRHIASDDALIRAVREHTYALRHRRGVRRPRWAWRRPRREKIIPPVDPDLIASELAGLSPEHSLCEHNGLRVCCARADEIPRTLLEIGRLREVTFREAGEGTGRSLDIDAFDAEYLHLFLYDETRREIAGAYRLGLTRDLVRARGVRGLYTSTLFRYDANLMMELGDAIELGRSFVRREYQRKRSCLPMLWQGIGTFIARNPSHRMLFGPVSMSAEYHPVSIRLMMRYLREHAWREDLAGRVLPRRPYRMRRVDAPPALWLSNADEVSFLVSDMEPDGKGIPVLLKHYLKLNARILGFNLDRSFGDVLDALILVDLTTTDRRMLKRFMGADGCRSFLAWHGIDAAGPRRPPAASA